MHRLELFEQQQSQRELKSTRKRASGYGSEREKRLHEIELEMYQQFITAYSGAKYKKAKTRETRAAYKKKPQRDRKKWKIWSIERQKCRADKCAHSYHLTIDILQILVWTKKKQQEQQHIKNISISKNRKQCAYTQHYTHKNSSYSHVTATATDSTTTK